MTQNNFPSYSVLLFSVGDECAEYSYFGFKNGTESMILARQTINFRRFSDDVLLKNAEHMIEHIRKIETPSNTERKKWWSYCPDWVFLEPYFIHGIMRPYLIRELKNALDGIFVHDLGEMERKRMKYWMRTLCDKFLESTEPVTF